MSGRRSATAATCSTTRFVRPLRFQEITRTFVQLRAVKRPALTSGSLLATSVWGRRMDITPLHFVGSQNCSIHQNAGWSSPALRR
jgi:hypothetical protein